jgi:hypothetical protein
MVLQVFRNKHAGLRINKQKIEDLETLKIKTHHLYSPKMARYGAKTIS